MITVVNNRSGVESEMSQAHWDNIKDTPQWKGVFRVKDTPVVKEPKEVTELKTKKGADSTQNEKTK